MITATDAREKLACEENPDDWFNPRLYEKAKAACQGCPIRGECQEIGFAAEYGVFGGLDEHDRQRIRPKEEPKRRKSQRRCGLKGCNEPHDANGLCSKHNQRMYVHGDPLYVPYSKAKKNSSKCGFPGCPHPYAAKGFCRNHHGRWFRYNGDVLGGKDHVSRSDETHEEIHRLFNAAMNRWFEVDETADTECLGLIEHAIELADRRLTRGEMDAIRGMGIKLTVDTSRMPRAYGMPEQEATMRHQAIVHMFVLGESKPEVARMLGVSKRTVDRALRAITTGVPARSVTRYQVER